MMTKQKEQLNIWKLQDFTDAKIARIESLHAENFAPEFGGFVRRLAAEQAAKESN